MTGPRRRANPAKPKPRVSNGRFKRQPETVDKTRQALELRYGGATYEQIGAALGIHTSSAFRLVEAGLARTLDEPAEHLRELEAARLDALQQAVWAKAMKGDLWAVDRALRISEQRSKLLGLDTLEERRTIATELIAVAVARGFERLLASPVLALSWELREAGRAEAAKILLELDGPAAA